MNHCRSDNYDMNHACCNRQGTSETTFADSKLEYDNTNRDSLCGLPLAMAYVPWQIWSQTYELPKGYQAGTIFPCLDKPFLGKGGCCL